MVRNNIELLAPAGDFPSLRAAVESGADAVYFGIEGFNMRDSAKNFKLIDLDKIKQICGKKVKKYLTLNIIIYDDELKKVDSILKKAKGKIDAVICWDISVINLCKKYKIEFHISTQASVSNREGALFYKKLGAKRIVLARELNLKQIRAIAKVVDVEVFAHGAMCVAVSGRCFTSQFLYGKSANRGECLQPCRKIYDVKDEDGNELVLENHKIMSAKDLCTLPIIEKIKRLGIKSIKIEGRNRPAEYVLNVVRVYRQALDKKMTRKDIENGLQELKKVYNRGFSEGFYLKVPGKNEFAKDGRFGESYETKQFIGKVRKYWPKIGVAAVYLNSGQLSIGDEIYVKGTDYLKRVKIESMQIFHKNVLKAVKGQEIGIKVFECKKGDDVYLIINKNK
jgi:U32 family peptidase